MLGFAFIISGQAEVAAHQANVRSDTGSDCAVLSLRYQVLNFAVPSPKFVEFFLCLFVIICQAFILLVQPSYALNGLRLSGIIRAVRT